MHKIQQIIIDSYHIQIKRKIEESFTFALLYPPYFFKWRCSNLTLRYVYTLSQMGARLDNGSTLKPATTLS
jgi:hypothetical protein